MKTILYHAITTYHLLEFMVHNLYYHHEQAVLIAPWSILAFLRMLLLCRTLCRAEAKKTL